ncbi:hypothetical protein CF319_g1350 [Tilletia indica]|nr:hypothetical protein CF319_g1350 [Tilletia indica]
MSQYQNRGSGGFRGGGGARGGAAAAAGSSGGADVAAILNGLDQQLQESMKKNNEVVQKWVKDEVKQKLAEYHQAARSFTTSHRLADLDDVQPSDANDDRLVIVMNMLELDELQDVLRGQRNLKQQLQQTQDQLTSAQDQIKDLEQKFLSLAKGGVTAKRRSVRRSDDEEGDDDGDPMDQDDEEGVEKENEPRHKRKKVARGRKDARIQKAFERLLRLKMGIEKGDAWPAFPTVNEAAPDWPREEPDIDVDSTEPDANIDPLLRENAPPLGKPLLRLDWVEGRMDDERFDAVLTDLPDELADHADDHDLPSDKRDVDYIRAACKRTLVRIKRSAREKLVKDSDELAKEQALKKKRDRRRSRHKTRFDARAAAAAQNPLAFGDAAAAMLVGDCVERDESETDAESDEGGDEADVMSEDGGTRKKTTGSLRALIPEWWSQQNRNLQARLAKEVPPSLSSYKVKAATHLQRHNQVLDKSIPRIAISSGWADAHPELVRRVKKNSAPFKPQRGAIADNPEQFGDPITDLEIIGVSDGGEGADGMNDDG